jgi:hypothetical protein
VFSVFFLLGLEIMLLKIMLVDLILLF